MKKHIELWPVGIVVTFIVFVGLCAARLVFAVNQPNDLVSKNYYEIETKYQQEIDKTKRSNNLHEPVAVAYEAEKGDIVLRFPAAFSIQGITGTALFFRPSDETMDFSTKLRPDAQGIQRIASRTLAKGLWKVKIDWKAGATTYYNEERLILQ